MDVPSGWTASKISFAPSYFFSKEWPYFSGQVVVLNGKDSFISQVLTLSKTNVVVGP